MKFDKSFFIAKFKEEADERLQKLNSNLVKLEANPDDEVIIDEIFRDAHTLKGSAKMVGLGKINQIGHKMEDVLGKVKGKQVPFTTELSDVLFECLDMINVLLDAEIKGEKKDIDIEPLLQRLEAAEIGKLKIREEKKRKKGVIPSQPVEIKTVAEEKKEERVKEKEIEEYAVEKEVKEEVIQEKEKIHVEETIRVGVGKLDALLNLTSEMVINKIRLNHLLESLKELRNLTVTQLFYIDQTKERISQSIKERIEEFNNLEKISQQVKSITGELFRKYSETLSRVSTVVGELEHVVMDVRMLPVSTVFDTFPRLVRDISREYNKEIELEIYGGDTGLDKMILEDIKDPLLHILRNCIDHGIESPEEREIIGKPRTGKIVLSACHEGSRIAIRIEDDGRGIDPQKVKQIALQKKVITQPEAEKLSEREVLYLIFKPGFSTKEIITDVSGRGVGLDVVKKNVEKLKGSVMVDSEIGKGTVFTLMLPLTLATIHALIIKAGSETFAIPTVAIEETLRVSISQIKRIVDKDVVIVNGRHIPVVRLIDVLGLPSVDVQKHYGAKLPIIILNVDEVRIGFLVDELLREEEIVIKNLGEYFKDVHTAAGATILGEGEVVIILNVSELIKSAKAIRETHLLEDIKEEQHPTYSILVVDDAVALRELQKSMLESAGYSVEVAADGQEAWEKAKSRHFDLIISDIEMPRMDGFQFTEALRKDEEYKDVPVIIVTAREREEDKKRGIEVGADAYIVKTSFDQSRLLEAVERLIG